MNAGQIQDQIAAVVRKTRAEMIIGGANICLMAINTARRSMERARDMNYSRVNAVLSVASTGSLITAATISSAPVSVKKIYTVSLPLNDTNLIPIEFLMEDDASDRIQRQIGRTPYDPALPLVEYGVSSANPFAYQQGQTLFLYPPTQFTFPITVQVGIIKFLPDYTADGDTDYFTEFAPDYLQWRAIWELNKYTKTWGDREEGNVNDDQVKKNSDEATAALIQWDESIRTSSNTQPAAAPNAPVQNG